MIDAVKSLPFVRFIPYMCIVLYGTCTVIHDVSYFLNDVFFEKLSLLLFITFKSIMLASIIMFPIRTY